VSISRVKFIFFFVILAFAFLFATTSLLDWPGESLVGSDSQGAWKSTMSTILSPVKIMLVGPLLPFIDFLHQDPDTPPPFFLVGFAFYWSILAFVLHYLLSKIWHPWRTGN
jgi:predicted membrane-bound mannosyltransferase